MSILKKRAVFTPLSLTHFSSIHFIDYFTSVIKSIVFGFTIGIVGTYKGFMLLREHVAWQSRQSGRSSGHVPDLYGRDAHCPDCQLDTIFIEMEKQSIKHIINRSESAIIIRDLYKSFEDLDVLKGVNLNVFKEKM